MRSPYIHERRRIMDPAKKVKFCQLIRESHSLEEAAEWVDVSSRTAQWERKRDEDFDHEIHLAQQATHDPMRLMENAARQAQAQAAAEQGERPVEWVSAPALFHEPPATLPMTARRPSMTPLSPKTDEATLGDTTTAKRNAKPPNELGAVSPKTRRATPVALSCRLKIASDARNPYPTNPYAYCRQKRTRRHQATRQQSKRQASRRQSSPSPPVAIDYNLPIEFSLAYDDFAAASRRKNAA